MCGRTEISTLRFVNTGKVDFDFESGTGLSFITPGVSVRSRARELCACVREIFGSKVLVFQRRGGGG